MISPVPEATIMNSSSGCVCGGCGVEPGSRTHIPATIPLNSSVGPLYCVNTRQPSTGADDSSLSSVTTPSGNFAPVVDALTTFAFCSAIANDPPGSRPSRSRVLASPSRGCCLPACLLRRRLVRPPTFRFSIRIECLLDGTQMIRNVLEVHAHARPGRKPSAHRIDENVGRLEVRGRIGMSRAPAFQSGERLFFFLGAPDLN